MLSNIFYIFDNKTNYNWNALPVNLGSNASINIFKNNLKTFLYECVFGECMCDSIFR